MNEDIDEIRQQRAHFEKGFANIKKRVAKSGFKDLKDAENKLSELFSRVNGFLSEMQVRVLKVFDEAEARLKDPNIRISARLDKQTKEIVILRDKLRQAESDLLKSRQGSQKSQNRLNELAGELAKLDSENRVIKDNADWNNEISGLRPLGKR
jgi:chromosome segregation ATPase